MHGRICIVGCTRSGTVYTRNLLNALGLDVRHEYLGRDGGVGFNFTYDRDLVIGDETNPGRPGRAGLTFDHLWHQVREPLGAIGSMLTHGSGTWKMIAQGLKWHAIPESMSVRAALYWLDQNALAEREAQWTYRVEDLRAGGSAWAEMKSRLGLDRPWPGTAPCNSRRGSRGHCIISWGDLHVLAPGLALAVRQAAGHFGYCYDEEGRCTNI